MSSSGRSFRPPPSWSPSRSPSCSACSSTSSSPGSPWGRSRAEASRPAGPSANFRELAARLGVMSYQPPQSPFPPPPGSPTGPEGQPTGAPPGYPPQGYGPGPTAGPPPAYTAPPPAPAQPRQAVSGRHLASLLLVAGTALLLLADLVAAFTAGNDGFDIEFLERLYLLGGAGGGFFFSIPTVLILSLLVIAALRLRDGSTGP